ncbi:MAG: hypothetical protein Q9172_004712 [Xanthocarpia lactea]
MKFTAPTQYLFSRLTETPLQCNKPFTKGYRFSIQPSCGPCLPLDYGNTIHKTAILPPKQNTLMDLQEAFRRLNRIDREYRRRVLRLYLCYNCLLILGFVMIILTLVRIRFGYPTSMYQLEAPRDDQVEGQALQDNENAKKGVWVPENQVLLTDVVVRGGQVIRDVVVQRGNVAYAESVVYGNITMLEKGALGKLWWDDGGLVVQ